MSLSRYPGVVALFLLGLGCLLTFFGSSANAAAIQLSTGDATPPQAGVASILSNQIKDELAVGAPPRAETSAAAASSQSSTGNATTPNSKVTGTEDSRVKMFFRTVDCTIGGSKPWPNGFQKQVERIEDKAMRLVDNILTALGTLLDALNRKDTDGDSAIPGKSLMDSIVDKLTGLVVSPKETPASPVAPQNMTAPLFYDFSMPTPKEAVTDISYFATTFHERDNSENEIDANKG